MQQAAAVDAVAEARRQMPLDRMSASANCSAATNMASTGITSS